MDYKDKDDLLLLKDLHFYVDFLNYFDLEIRHKAESKCREIMNDLSRRFNGSKESIDHISKNVLFEQVGE